MPVRQTPHDLLYPPPARSLQICRLRVIKQHVHDCMDAHVAIVRQVPPVHPLKGPNHAVIFGHCLEDRIERLAVEVQHLRRLEAGQPVMQNHAPRIHQAARHVTRMHEIVVLSREIRMRRRADCPLPSLLPMQVGGIAPAIVGRDADIRCPPVSRIAPFLGPGMTVQEARREVYRMSGPPVFLGLGIVICADLGDLVTPAVCIPCRHIDRQLPRFVVKLLPKQPRGQTHPYHRAARLARHEKRINQRVYLGTRLTPFPQRAVRVRALDAHALIRPGHVGETQIPDRPDGVLKQPIRADATRITQRLRRPARHCIRQSRIGRLQTVPVAPPEKVPAVGPLRPFPIRILSRRQPVAYRTQVQSLPYLRYICRQLNRLHQFYQRLINLDIAHPHPSVVIRTV